jgi:uncharacterized protein (TIGR03000 family)
MRRHGKWAAAVLLGAAALLLAPGTSSAQISIGAPFYGGQPSPLGYSAYPYGPGATSWGSAFSYTQRYYWYGDNWPYRGYFVGTYHGVPFFPSDGVPRGVKSPPVERSGYYSYGSTARTEWDTVLVTVRVPDPDAEVWIEGKATRQQGTRREFISPPLDPDKSYTYEVRARWTENGRTVERIRNVPVRASEAATADFTTPANGSR